MDNILRVWFALLTIIRVSHSSTILSIPLYQRAMVKHETVKEHDEPNAEATADIFPADDAYAMFLWVGTPVQIVFLIIDTGSPITWFQCGPCTHCYPMHRPLFNSRASTSFRQLGCSSDTCLIPMMRGIFGNCTGRSCRYSVEYDMKSQSRSSGVMVTDTLNFEHSNVDVKEEFIMGCGDSYEGSFRTQFSGVLGLGRGPLSMQSQLHAKAFSFCIVSVGSEKPSSLEFYETLHKQHGNSNRSIMVPLRENSRYPFYYFVQLVGIGINGFMLDIPSRVWGYGLNYDGGVVIDTGKVLTYLPSEAYSVFRSEILRTDGNFTKKGYEELEFCYVESTTDVYPIVEFYFENGNIAGENFVSFKLNNRQLLITQEEGVVCLAFAEAKNSALTVIGTNHLQGTLLTYNLVDEIIILTYNNC